MPLQLTKAQSLGIIDREVGDHFLTPAEYEIVRQVIYHTADFEYKSLIRFSDRSLEIGAAALAARTTIVVDVPMVRVGLIPLLQKTFVNSVYCGLEIKTRPHKANSSIAWGIHTLAHRYREGIFIIGQDRNALETVIELIEAEIIKPALIIATLCGFLEIEVFKERLQDTMIPYISVDGRKGNPVVAVAIVNGLINLAWQVYQENEQTKLLFKQ